MKFDNLYKEILSTLITEDDVENTNDILEPEQDSALSGVDGVENDINVDKIIYLTNILLDSIRFKPSDEVSAYLKMPKFHNLSASQKLATIKNLLQRNPEKIIKESEDNLEEFGDGTITGLTENEEMDLLRLIIRALNVNPFAMSIVLKELPSKADENNYEGIIETIENVIF